MAAAARASVDRRRLARVLGMLGSDHDGEVAAAGRRANAIIQQAGLSWAELLLDLPVIRLVPPPPAEPIDTDEIISAALARFARLNLWERHFVGDLAERRPRRLSERQLAALERIADKIGFRR